MCWSICKAAVCILHNTRRRVWATFSSAFILATCTICIIVRHIHAYMSQYQTSCVIQWLASRPLVYKLCTLGKYTLVNGLTVSSWESQLRHVIYLITTTIIVFLQSSGCICDPYLESVHVLTGNSFYRGSTIAV